jgi:hypothetical protein
MRIQRKEATMNGKHLRTITVLILGLFMLTACGLNYVQGSGNVITEERHVSGFDSVDMSGFGEVFITQGDTESLTIETDDNLMQYIESVVRGNTLYLEFEDNTIPDPSGKITFRLNVIDLEALDLSGAGSFIIDSLETSNLEITFGGAGKVDLDSLLADRVSTRVSGAGDISLTGEVGAQDIHIAGVGKYVAPDLKSNQATVQIEGAGSVVIWVVDELDLTVQGAGNVDYYGNPTVTQNIEGGGKINSMGAK